MADDTKNEQLSDVPLISLPPFVPGEHEVGIQISVGGLVKEKLEESATSFLRERGETLLQAVLVEARSIVTLEKPDQLDPKGRNEDVVRAFDRVVRRYAQRSEQRSRIHGFLREVPCSCLLSV